MSELIEKFNSTGPCVINIDELEKCWDHRFLLSQWEDEFRLIQYLRRGSGATKIKCTIDNNQAHEIINRLKLVRTDFGKSAASWRPAHLSELDMRRKKKMRPAA